MAPKSDDLGPLERVTINFIRRSSAALRLAMQVNGLSKTDTINRHVQLGAYIEWQESRGTKFFMQEEGAEQPSRLIFSPVLPSPDEIERMLGPDDSESTAPEPTGTH